MNEPENHCPVCGAELASDGGCPRCGKLQEPSHEVEYKDFKGTEMLDIRPRRPSPETAAPAHGHDQDKAGDEPEKRRMHAVGLTLLVLAGIAFTIAGIAFVVYFARQAGLF